MTNQSGTEEQHKDVTDKYTGSDNEEFENYEPDEGTDQSNSEGMDATALGIDNEQVGQLTAWGMSYFVARPREIEVNGNTYNLQAEYINSARDEFAELAKGLNVEKQLEQLNITDLTAGQALALYGALGVGLMVKQRREFQKQVDDFKKDIEEDKNNAE